MKPPQTPKALRLIDTCSTNGDEGDSTIGSDDGRDEDDTGAKRKDLVPLRLIKPHGCAERAVCSVE